MYYVGKNGSQSGPYPLDEMRNMASSGRLAATDLIWTEGMSEWKPAGAALPDLFSKSAPAAPIPGVVAQSPSPFPAPQGLPSPPSVDLAAMGAPIPTYLWQSIVVTLCCCPLFGIPAIVFASQVESKRQHGDIAGAMKSSKNAKLWTLIALLSGIFCNLSYGGFMYWNMSQKGMHF
jgi:hypothetical protein